MRLVVSHAPRRRNHLQRSHRQARCAARDLREVRAGWLLRPAPVSFEKRGRDAKLIDWLDELTAECPKGLARKLNDPCGARCRDLARVLWRSHRT